MKASWNKLTSVKMIVKKNIVAPLVTKCLWNKWFYRSKWAFGSLFGCFASVWYKYGEMWPQFLLLRASFISQSDTAITPLFSFSLDVDPFYTKKSSFEYTPKKFFKALKSQQWSQKDQVTRFPIELTLKRLTISSYVYQIVDFSRRNLTQHQRKKVPAVNKSHIF